MIVAEKKNSLKVVVTVKSIGCLQIGFGPWSSIIFAIFYFTPLASVNQILSVLNRSQVCPLEFTANCNVFSSIWTPFGGEKDKLVSDLKHFNT